MTGDWLVEKMVPSKVGRMVKQTADLKETL